MVITKKNFNQRNFTLGVFLNLFVGKPVVEGWLVHSAADNFWGKGRKYKRILIVLGKINQQPH